MKLGERQRVAERAAREAGLLARRFLADRDALAVTFKGPQDVVTAADAAVERLIVAELRRAFPDDAFVGEESGGVPSEFCWVIDPIDGTANFARALPHWGVSIAFVADGAVQVGVVYDPNEDRLYSASRGAGATCNGSSIEVSATADIARATIDVGWSRRTATAEFAAMVERLLDLGANVTQCGSAALGLARVADGRIDGYAERHLYAWDALAGLLLIEEAGGRVNAFLAGDALLAGNATVAATPELYGTLAAALNVPGDAVP